MLDVRADFPVTRTRLTSPVTGEAMPLVYFDHGASTHAPESVLHAHERFIREAYSNVHRGAHHLSIVSTEAYEDVRFKCKAFVGARRDQEVVFAENTTHALNLAAHLMEPRPGVTLVSSMEHHSNDLPHRARGPVVHFGVDENGQVDMRDFEKKLANHRVKLVAVTMASNVTGIRPPLDEIVDLAHAFGARVLVDGAQGLAHLPIDLARMGTTGGPDFFAAAAHKAYAPMGGAFLVAPRVVALGFQITNGKLIGPRDLFADPSFDHARRQASEVMDYLRRHGPFEPHRLPLEDLEYTTMATLSKRLADRWQPMAEPQVPTAR
jgi:cysteine desulfurase / selenocysteine lyase